LQTWGTAMGTRLAPGYANLFMGDFEEYAFEIGEEHVRHIYEEFYVRFIDDGFLLWCGTENELKDFVAFLNGIHPTIQFSCTYDFNTREVSFLDVSVRISRGKIITDLYRKPTAVSQYLLPSSCHPHFVTKNIPYSLCYRLLRICSEPATLKLRLNELKDLLLLRHYDPKVIDRAIARISGVSREAALQKVEKTKTSDKITFVVPFDPRYPPINCIVKKHFDVMYQDPYLKRVFGDGVQVSYRRHQNLRELLCRARLYPLSQNPRPKRELNGWMRCSKNCVTCIHSSGNRDKFRATATGKTFEIRQRITCTDINLIYVVECAKCLAQYVGKTKGAFKTRMNAHRSSIGKGTSSLGQHFEGPGHTSRDFTCFAIEIVRGGDIFTLGARERLWIDRLDTVSRGLNSYRTHK